MKEKVTIIAEAGVNHNGSLKVAKKMVDIAIECKVDYIKFQTFKPEELVSKFAVKAEYQQKNMGSNESQLQMLQKLILSPDAFVELEQYCNKRQIKFLSTPFDIPSIEFLSNFNMDFWKIPSGEITNYPYLVKIAQTKKPVIMSTGMSHMNEIREALKVLRENGCSDVKLLHCNTEYPTPYEDVNLLAMEVMREEFKVVVGYSDHTLGIEIPIAAVALGATIIEKHFTLDKDSDGPDHKASLQPQELAEMVKAIRNTENSIGERKKEVSESERKNINIVRKSIVAKKKIAKGEILTEDNITTKRPADGINPMRWNQVMGTIANSDYSEDEIISL